MGTSSHRVSPKKSRLILQLITYYYIPNLSWRAYFRTNGYRLEHASAYTVAMYVDLQEKAIEVRRYADQESANPSLKKNGPRCAEHPTAVLVTATTTIGCVLKRRKVSMREPIILNLCYMASKTEVRILPTARGRSLLINKCFLVEVFKCLLRPANDRASQSASHLEFLPSKFRVCEKPLS